MSKSKEEKEDPHDNGDNGSVTTTTKVIEWSPENEMIMVEWCDHRLPIERKAEA